MVEDQLFRRIRPCRSVNSEIAAAAAAALREPEI